MVTAVSALRVLVQLVICDPLQLSETAVLFSPDRQLLTGDQCWRTVVGLVRPQSDSLYLKQGGAAKKCVKSAFS